MITTDVPRGPRAWLLLLSFAALPFLLRLQLDLRQVELMAVQDVYRVWRWSPEGRVLRTGATLVFKKHDDKSAAEELFLRQVQKDFKVVEYGDFPRVRAYFGAERRLRARIEVQAGAQQTIWEGESRYPDNGILAGPWLGAVLALMGRPPWVSVSAAAITMLAWDSGWNPLDMPARAIGFFSSFGAELRERFARGDWVASELGRVPALGLLIWLLPAFFLLWKVSQRPELKARSIVGFVGGTLLLEPLCLWTSELFGKWDAGASWWKVYLGSFAYRFVLGAFLVARYLRPLSLEWGVVGRWGRRFRWLALLLPAAFVAGSGWEWLSSLLVPGAGDTLLRFRVFLIGWLLAFMLGTRAYSLWLGCFALAVQLPPTTGHWNASALFGFLADGLLLGWWMTPLKGFWIRPPETWPRVGALALIAWVAGILLSSVGVPLGICWIALVAAVWAYMQLLAPARPAPQGIGAEA